MALNLQIDQALSTTAQAVKDQSGHDSSFALSTDMVGIGTTVPGAKLNIPVRRKEFASKARQLEMPMWLT